MSKPFAFQVGLTGNRFTLRDLAGGIRRPRDGKAVHANKYAKILAEKLQELSDRRWARIIKGQRVPTPKQAAEAVAQIVAATEESQVRAKERRVTPQQVICTAREAGNKGRAFADGGKVTASSYGYSWSTSTIFAERQAGGMVKVTIDRSAKREITLPAKVWKSISLDYVILSAGGDFAIRRKHGWDCYSADGFGFVGVTIPVTDAKVKQRYIPWEHGLTVADAQAEIARKRAIIDADEAAKALTEQQAARQERAARLLARIGVKTMVGYDDARAVGACDGGIRAFAERNGFSLDAKLPLAEIAKVEPAWALKLARRIVAAAKA